MSIKLQQNWYLMKKLFFVDRIAQWRALFSSCALVYSLELCSRIPRNKCLIDVRPKANVKRVRWPSLLLLQLKYICMLFQFLTMPLNGPKWFEYKL